MTRQAHGQATRVVPDLAHLERRFSSRGIARSRIRRALGAVRWTLDLALGKSKRALDLVAGLILSVAAAPFALLLGIYRLERVGRYGVTFQQMVLRAPAGRIGRFMTSIRFHLLASAFNVVRGEMSFVGPRPLTPEEALVRDAGIRRRLDVRPGLICIWWVRRRANIDYDAETTADIEYVETFSVRTDLGIAARAAISGLYGAAPTVAPDQIAILGMRIDNLTMDAAIDRILELADRPEPARACFVNADCANIAGRNAAYRAAVADGDLTLADGIGMKLAGKMLRSPIRQNVNGTDLFPRLCAVMASQGKRLYLLGGRPGVAETAANAAKALQPDLTVCGTHHGYYSAEEEGDVLREIREARPDVLLVAFGAPRQDLWIAERLRETGAGIAIGVGGLLDFYSERVRRAPQWVREIGMEWVVRLLNEPGRLWKRYLVGNGVFLMRVALACVSSARLGR